MSVSRLQSWLLLVIAVALSGLALRPLWMPMPVAAQGAAAGTWFVEPGVQMLVLPDGGQVLGKVAIDMRTGDVWGLPTYGNASYPLSLQLGAKASVSHPFRLGRFAVEEMK